MYTNTDLRSGAQQNALNNAGLTPQTAAYNQRTTPGRQPLPVQVPPLQGSTILNQGRNVTIAHTPAVSYHTPLIFNATPLSELPASFSSMTATVKGIDISHNLIQTTPLNGSESHRWNVPQLSEACLQDVTRVGNQILIKRTIFGYTIEKTNNLVVANSGIVFRAV